MQTVRFLKENKDFNKSVKTWILKILKDTHVKKSFTESYLCTARSHIKSQIIAIQKVKLLNKNFSKKTIMWVNAAYLSFTWQLEGTFSNFKPPYLCSFYVIYFINN